MKGLLMVASAASSNAATRLESFVLGTGTYAYGGHADSDDLFRQLDEQVERLAHHAFRGEMWDNALTYFREAGIKAGSRFAYREGAACFEQALAALTHLPESRSTLEQGIDLRISLRTALLPLGEIRRIHDLLRDAATLAETLDDQRRLMRISDRLCHASWQIGDYGAALDFGQRALAISMVLGDVNRQLDTNVNLANT